MKKQYITPASECFEFSCRESLLSLSTDDNGGSGSVSETELGGGSALSNEMGFPQESIWDNLGDE